MLKLRFKNNKYNAVWLVEPKVSVGRLATNDLVVNDTHVADVQFEILVDHENLTLNNLVPTLTCLVNGEVQTAKCALQVGDIIAFGVTELEVIDPKREVRDTTVPLAQATENNKARVTGWALKAQHLALANRVYPLKDEMLIGRSSDCDISLSAAHLSRRHAQLSVVDGLLYVKDLDSANGTFLNGKQILEARVRRGDELRFDTLSFGVIGPADDLGKTTVRSQGKPMPGNKASVAQSIKKPASNVVVTHTHTLQDQGAPTNGRYSKYSMTLLVILTAIVVAALFLKG